MSATAMRILQLRLSICVVILFCDRGKTSNTTTLRSRKPTIGPIFLTVSQSPNQPNVLQVLIRFAGPPDTLVLADFYKDLNKVQVSGGDFVSVVDLEEGNDFFILSLSSEATSERLLFNVRPVIGYYKIYQNCNIDVTSSDVEEITTYTIVISECSGEETEGGLEEWGLWHELFKGTKQIPSADYLTIEENQQSTLGNVTTVSFNKSSLMNNNVDMTLYFYLLIYTQNTLVPRIYWNYLLD
ncbi:uncharacterized protein LOC128172133 [Crassostrea angulata]|uniref:uncharacterized protein LOC128172133 n=1 Tax=Magallana angulata TaxID=2784310 RepID=UPI0022B1223C|nr:uncharacterized protein LOC128172133 [Crassostrea angulata]